MSGYAVMLRGERLRALVVGGGAVAARKVAALVESGAAVEVIAPDAVASLAALADEGRISISSRRFEAGDIATARLVFAATDDRAVNARVAELARAAGALVNIADDPEGSDFVTPAMHRAGELTVSVSAGRVPGAAARVRDAIAARFDDRYADAIARLTTLRAARVDGDARTEWRDAAALLLGADFCESVEDGRFGERMARWG